LESEVIAAGEAPGVPAVSQLPQGDLLLACAAGAFEELLAIDTGVLEKAPELACKVLVAGRREERQEERVPSPGPFAKRVENGKSVSGTGTLRLPADVLASLVSSRSSSQALVTLTRLVANLTSSHVRTFGLSCRFSGSV